MAKNDDSCSFVAGTPVWTDRGLVPIEQIKIGDKVLSKCDSTGEVAYKPVVRTFVTEDQEIVYAEMRSVINIVDGKEVKIDDYFFMTANHPLWLVNRGWISVTEAGELNADVHCEEDDIYRFSLINGEVCEMLNVLQVFQAPGEPNVGLITNYGFLAMCEGRCSSVVFDGAIDRYQTNFWDERLNGATFQRGDEVRFESIDWYYQNEPDPNYYRPFRTTVYNIEVEDFHTYFVGEVGLWVNSACQITEGGIKNKYA